eukprot:395317-Amorphochlora_amoeboformis.AAC.3
MPSQALEDTNHKNAESKGMFACDRHVSGISGHNERDRKGDTRIEDFDPNSMILTNKGIYFVMSGQRNTPVFPQPVSACTMIRLFSII